MNLHNYQEKINIELESYLNSEIKNISDPFIKYCYELIKEYSQGGKRLRPTALILAYEACNGKGKDIFLSAISVELYHTYTMILDDIMDEDEFRRNKPTVYKKIKDNFSSDVSYDGSLFNSTSSRYAVSFGVLIGNITARLSRMAIVNSNFSLKYEALKKLEKMDQLISHGQILDLKYENQTITEDQYFNMIKSKTSALFGTSFEIGSLLAGADEHTQHIFKEFGINLAMSFQIQDDLLDLTNKKGHDIGSDIRKGKQTLLMIKTMENVNNEQKKIIQKIIGNQKVSESQVNAVVKIMHDTKAVDYCKKLARQKYQQATELITNPVLSEFADSMINFFK